MVIDRRLFDAAAVRVELFAKSAFEDVPPPIPPPRRLS